MTSLLKILVVGFYVWVDIDSKMRITVFSCIPHTIEILIRSEMKIFNSVSFAN